MANICFVFLCMLLAAIAGCIYIVYEVVSSLIKESYKEYRRHNPKS